MGDRVAVLQRRHPAAVRDATRAVHPAGQHVRRRLHRLTGDEHAAVHGDRRRAVVRRVSRCHSPPSQRTGADVDQVTIGVRPEGAADRPRRAARPRSSPIEELGSDSFVYCTPNGHPDVVAGRPNRRPQHRASPARPCALMPDTGVDARVRHRQRCPARRPDAMTVRHRPADRSVPGHGRARRRHAPGPAEPAVDRLPVLRRRPRGTRPVRGALVPQPLAGDAGRPVRGRAVHPDHDATLCVARRRRACARSSTCGPSARPRSARATTSTSCSCSRTAARRSVRRSPIRTARSTPTTTCRNARSLLEAGGSPRPTAATGSSPASTDGVGLDGVRARRHHLPDRADAGAPTSRSPTCRRSTTTAATRLAALLVDVLDRLDRLYDQPLPYMMWLNQRPTDGQRLAAGVVQHRDRVAVAQRRRRSLHRRRRGGVRRVLQSGDSRRSGSISFGLWLVLDSASAPASSIVRLLSRAPVASRSSS